MDWCVYRYNLPVGIGMLSTNNYKRCNGAGIGVLRQDGMGPWLGT